MTFSDEGVLQRVESGDLAGLLRAGLACEDQQPDDCTRAQGNHEKVEGEVEEEEGQGEEGEEEKEREEEMIGRGESKCRLVRLVFITDCAIYIIKL